MSKKYVISVAQRYSHTGRGIKHRKNTHKRWHEYFIDEDGFHCQRISKAKAIILKMNRYHLHNFTCNVCGYSFAGLNKSGKPMRTCDNCLQD